MKRERRMAKAEKSVRSAMFNKEVEAAHHSAGTHVTIMHQGNMDLPAHMASLVEDVVDSVAAAGDVDVVDADVAVEAIATERREREIRKRTTPPEKRPREVKTMMMVRQVFRVGTNIRLENIWMKIRQDMPRLTACMPTRGGCKRL